MKFRLIDGVHSEVIDANNSKVYHRGDVIETSVDLAARYNTRGFPPKFERLIEDAPNTHVFDPARETVEQFAERMRAHAVPQGAQPAQAQHAQLQPALAIAAEPPKSAQLDAMSEGDLRKLADTHEVDIKGAKGREAVLKALRTAGL